MGWIDDIHAQRDHMRQFLGILRMGIGNAAGALYLSAPMTSGRRYIEWRKASGMKPGDEGYQTALYKHVLEPNVAEARARVQAFRNNLEHRGRHIIDPTVVSLVPGWNDPLDYLAFCDVLITQHVARLVFPDGWQYSRRCAYEFYVGVREKRYVNSGNLFTGRVIDKHTGRRLIEDACEELATLGQAHEMHEEILGKLREL